MTRTRAQVLAVGTCVLLWSVSLALPALEISGGPTLRGIDVLFRGWQGISSGVYAWLANPLFALAAVVCVARAWRTGLTVAGAACVAGLTSFAANALAARGGANVPEFMFVTGFYVWLTSLVALAVCAAHESLPRRDTARS